MKIKMLRNHNDLKRNKEVQNIIQKKNYNEITNEWNDRRLILF